MRAIVIGLVTAWSLTVATFAQVSKGPTAFADIPWGVSMAELKAAFETKPGVKFHMDVPYLHKTAYVGGTMAGRNVTQWHFWFKAEKFGKAMVEFGNEPGAYPDLKQKLTIQYGRPKSEKSARGERETVWEFPASPTNGATSISLEMKPDKGVRLVYLNLQVFDTGADNKDL